MRAIFLFFRLLLALLIFNTFSAHGATGGGGTGTGGFTNTYKFNGPFTVQNTTNVFIAAVISNQLMTGISPGATNAGFYIGSSNGLGTNTTFFQSTTNPALTISPLIGSATNRLSVLNSNGTPVVLVTSNDIFTASNTLIRGTLQGSVSVTAPAFFDSGFTGAKVLVSEPTPTGEILESSTIDTIELGRLDGLTTDLAAKNNNVNLTTNLTGAGTVSISSNNTGGWTITGAAGSIDTTPFALLSRTTNSWADGSNGVRNVYTNVFHSTSGGVTNVLWTNMADGQTLSTWLFPSNGVTVGFPQFTTSDHIDGSVITPATNIWSLVQVTRRGTSTNILVATATYALVPSTGITFTTNFITREITVTSSSASAAGNNGDIQWKQGTSTTATNLLSWDTNGNNLRITGTAANSTNRTRPRLTLSNTTFSSRIELNTDGISLNHPTDIFHFLVGANFEDYGTNILSIRPSSIQPDTTNQMDLGKLEAPFNNVYFDSVTNLSTFHMYSGAGSGKILTSDGNGVGTWQNPSGGGATRDNISASATATNLSLDSAKTFVLTNDLRVDVTYALSNLTEGVKAEIHILGQTNAATNHIVAFTAAQGGTINWQGSGTNGPSAFTVFSNATATVYLKVVTNLTQTNIIATWIQDSYWPQPMAVTYSGAGGSTSNVFSGGLIYYDYTASSVPYTNHNSTGANYTNLACVMLPANLLTNLGDSVEVVWRGRFRGANNGTNQIIGGIGTITNGLGDTGQFTNRADAAWQYRVEVTTVGPTNHSTYWEFQIGGATTLTGSITNYQTGAFATGILTNGATNIIRLQHKGLGAGAITNDFLKVRYQPGIR